MTWVGTNRVTARLYRVIINPNYALEKRSFHLNFYIVLCQLIQRTKNLSQKQKNATARIFRAGVVFLRFNRKNSHPHDTIVREQRKRKIAQAKANFLIFRLKSADCGLSLVFSYVLPFTQPQARHFDLTSALL